MLRILAIAALLAAGGCNKPGFLMNSGEGGTMIPGSAIKAYATAEDLSPQEARQAMIADHLTTKGASIPKKALKP